MRFAFAASALLVSLAYATPIDGEFSLISREADQPIGELEWEGQLHPGGPNVTISGTAKEIYEEIVKRNPEYDPWNFDDYVEEMAEHGITKESEELEQRWLESRSLLDTLETRDIEKRARPGKIMCNKGSMINNFAMQCREGDRYLRKLGNKMCGAKGNSCARVSCSHNCGMYLCARTSKGKKVKCSSIAKDTEWIASKCGRTWGSGNLKVYRAKGHLAFKEHYIRLSATSC